MNRKNVIAILTAAGSGIRFNIGAKSGKPKQFLKLKNKPVILYPLIAMQKCKAVSGFFIVSSPDYFDFLHSLAQKHKITKLMALVEGGKTRFESVKNAFSQIEFMTEADYVVIHDAARPNISVSFIENLIKGAFKYGNVIPGTPVSETVKRVKNSVVMETVSRENLWTVQTPQLFRYKDLMESYRKAKRKDFTDEASMVEAAGFKVRIIEGSRTNIKITTPEDLKLLSSII
jgi:2-C-methyl-D-erythritol 4-phosphate cytidylyltransferase